MKVQTISHWQKLKNNLIEIQDWMSRQPGRCVCFYTYLMLLVCSACASHTFLRCHQSLCLEKVKLTKNHENNYFSCYDSVKFFQLFQDEATYYMMWHFTTVMCQSNPCSLREGWRRKLQKSKYSCEHIFKKNCSCKMILSLSVWEGLSTAFTS